MLMYQKVLQPRGPQMVAETFLFLNHRSLTGAHPILGTREALGENAVLTIGRLARGSKDGLFGK